MMSLWPLAIVLLVVLILIAVLRSGSRLFPGTRLWRYAFRCPLHERDVDVEFRETVWDGRPVDVTRCSFFRPPTAVTCAKSCLRLAPAAPPASAASEN